MLLISLRTLPKDIELFPRLFPLSAWDVLRPPTAIILVRSLRHRNGSLRRHSANEPGEALSV